jgi:hypothetical protein
MAKLSALVQLKDISKEFFLKSKLPQVEYAHIKQLSIRAYQDLVFTILPEARVVEKYTMDAELILTMPTDLVELNAVYIALDNGEMWPLSKNRKMTRTVSAGTTRNPDSPDYEGVETDHPGGRYYAASGGVNTEGYYIEDFANRRILFTNVEQSEIILDYLSTGIEDVESAYVPVQAVSAIHAWIAKHYYSYMPNVPANKIMLYNEDLKREKQKLRIMKFNLEDFYQSILKTMVASIQR